MVTYGRLFKVPQNEKVHKNEILILLVNIGCIGTKKFYSQYLGNIFRLK